MHLSIFSGYTLLIFWQVCGDILALVCQEHQSSGLVPVHQQVGLPFSISKKKKPNFKGHLFPPLDKSFDKVDHIVMTFYFLRNYVSPKLSLYLLVNVFIARIHISSYQSSRYHT